ncbi:pilus assembly protein [Sphingomonas cannabina]|uniref:TadE/TadG family type IV pilus assembly protein n=1 Tax=Sphingomonas cannabina TaxID=2899123 RepID=UPI001F18A3B2|nr:TadE/TadG family type IV pilus assembly protein [Sphingomonas cannabina]UIJ43675.1 pilus assembly protein [Sphingomonas cannabina]
MIRLAKDRRGVALTEFALALPFLILLLVGAYQFSDAVSAYRKVTTTTKTVADLTSQFTSVSQSDVNTILNASAQVLTPYSAAASKITVSQIHIDDKLVATVDWSQGKNIIGLTKGAAFELPAEVKQPDTYVIVAAVDYRYDPIVAANLIGTINMHDQIIMGPRASNLVKMRTS